MEGLKEDIDIIKSLIAICREGYLPLDKINREYREMTGSSLNFRKYGYSSLVAMLESASEIRLRQRPEGIVCHVNDEKMSHVTSLIQRTRAPKRTKRFKPQRRKGSFQCSSYRSPLQQRRCGPMTYNQDSSRRPFQPMNRNSYGSQNRVQSSSSQQKCQSGTSRPEYRQQSTFGNSSSSYSLKRSQSPISQRRCQSGTSRLEYNEQTRFGVSSTSASQKRIQSADTQRSSDGGLLRPQLAEPPRNGSSYGSLRSGSGRDQSKPVALRESKTTYFTQVTNSSSKMTNCDHIASSSVSSTFHAQNKRSDLRKQNTCEITGRKMIESSLNAKGRQQKASSSSGWSDDSDTNVPQSTGNVTKSDSQSNWSSDLSGYEVSAEKPSESSKIKISSQIKSNGHNAVSDGIGDSSEWTSDSGDERHLEISKHRPKKFISNPLSATASKWTGNGKVETHSSDSEWSSHSEKSLSGEQERNPASLLSRFVNVSPPLQNTRVSSTSKCFQEQSQRKTMVKRVSCSFGARDVRYISKKNESGESGQSGPQSVIDGRNDDYDCPPLMVGGVGRGKLQAYVLNRKPGGIQASSNQIIAVTGSPTKREASVISSNGLQSIAVTVQNSNNVSSEDAGPSFNGYVMIGDLFLLEVAKVSLGYKIKRAGPVTYCGMCRNKLTIAQCENEIVKNGVPSKVILMIGMTDIMKGASLQEMKDDTLSLIRRLKNYDVLLITIPAPPSFLQETNKEKLNLLLSYNKWLLSLKSYSYTVINVDEHLYCDRQYFRRLPGQTVETLSEGGCSNVMHEIVSVIC